MCGICGTIGLSGAASVEAMNREMIHRGPDNVGLWREGQTCLGHTRLSIIDLSSAGHQPMSNEDETLWITFNGEIYNFPALKQDLETQGHRFKSKTDIEVVVHLYEEYAERCLGYLRGMFAFAIWDKTKNRLFAARDRFGIKPLFYYFKNDKFIFSSELKAMLASGLIKKDIDMGATRDYFTYGSVQLPQTMIKDVFQLLPGHYIVLENSKLKIQKYWSINPTPRPPGSQKKEEEYITDIANILDEAVRIRMVSDVPLGALLSGGTDSSAIVSVMQRHSPHPIKTFSIVFEEADYDEKVFSRKIARIFGTDHREILLKEKDILKDMQNIFTSMDQPSIDGFNTFVISKAIRDAGLTVALSGLGGDELFAGYPSFKILPAILASLKIIRLLPKKARTGMAYFFKEFVKTKQSLKLFFSFLKCENLDELYFLKRSIFFPEDINGILGVADQSKIDNVLDVPQEKGMDIINRLSFLEITTYVQNMLLQDTDRMSMANSLEVRIPFLDHILVEKMFEIPGYLKIKRGYPKHLLVKSMQGLLPEEICNRPKKGFVLPFENWLKNELKSYCEDTLSRENLKHIAIFDSANVRNIWQVFLNGSGLYNYSSILALVSFVNWYRRNILA